MSKFEDPVVISCSISGAIANRDQCPAIPYTPEEYARRGEARGRRGRLADPHPRSHSRRDALVRDRGLPGDHRGDQGRRRRRDHQLLDGRDRDPDREAAGVPARAAAGRGGPQHELDELRQVLEAAQGLRLQGRVRELVRHDHRLPRADAGARDQARARVLRRRPHRQPRPADRHGAARRAAERVAGDRRQRRHPPRGQERSAHVGPGARRPGGPQQLAGDRNLARPVEAASAPRWCSAATFVPASRTTSTCRTARWRAPTAI